MAKFLTEYGTVVESDKPQPGWEPTKEALTAPAPAAGKESSFGDYAKTFGESAASGAIDAITAPVRLLGAGASALGGLVEGHPVANTFEHSGRQFLEDAAGKDYGDAARARAAANPTTAALGSAAGQIAGAVATGGLTGGLGRAATGALGGGLAARVAGVGITGAAEGAQLGLAGAGDQAYLQKQALDGEHALAAAGIGALFGGGLSLAGKAAGEAFTAGASRAAPALEAFADKSPALVARGISDAGDKVAKGVVKTGLKAAGVTHGIGGYLLGDAAGEVAAPAVSNFIQQNSGRLGALAQRGAKAAASALDGAMALGETAAPVFKLAGAGAAKTALDVFQGPHDTPEKAYAARVDELQSLSANQGEGVRDAVANMFGPAAHGQQAAVVSATQTAQRGIDYLMSKIPSAGVAVDSLTPITDKPTPDRVELGNFGRIYSAVMQPTTVLRDIKLGLVTKDQLDAVKAVYPTWFQSNILDALGPKLRNRDVEGRRLLPPEQHVLNLALGIDTGADSAAFGARYGDAFAKVGLPASSQSASTGGAARKIGNSKFASSFSTPTNTDLGG